jgi:hypothetical protein
MDKATVELLARRAGLEKALKQFPEDVRAASEAMKLTLRSASSPKESGDCAITRIP